MLESDKNKQENVAKLYQEWNELIHQMDLVHDMSEDIAIQDLEYYYNLKQMKQKALTSQTKIIETMIKDIIGATPSYNGKEYKLSLEGAVSLIKAVEDKAKSMKVSVVIAVFNEAARPIVVHCMDESYIASYDIACNKAYTCAALKMSTITLKELSQPGKQLYGIQNTNEGKIVIFGGGEALFANGNLIGAIGVSGGSEEEDTYLASFAKAKLEEVMKW